jgi:hypothetical protein
MADQHITTVHSEAKVRRGKNGVIKKPNESQHTEWYMIYI